MKRAANGSHDNPRGTAYRDSAIHDSLAPASGGDRPNEKGGDAHSLSIGVCAQVACVLEATARKPGNVHPFSHSANDGYVDLLLSAAVVGPVLQKAADQGIGQTVLEGVRATRHVVGHNTNLGILLLLAPLAAVPRNRELAARVGAVLAATTHEDARAVYEAIRLAQPGGLGTVPQQDVAAEPTCTLVEAMALASERDVVARQYGNGFREVLGDGVPYLAAALGENRDWEQAVVRVHLHLMGRYPDSLIARKSGRSVAEEAASRAAALLKTGEAAGEVAPEELDKFDRWLRADGNRRNPGTTADLVAACLFAALRDGIMTLPL